MTREEAIQFFERGRYKEADTSYRQAYNEAIDMAISALQEESRPISNCVTESPNEVVKKNDEVIEPSEIVPDVVCVSLNNGEQYYFSREAMLQQTKPTNALKETETKEHDDLIIKNGKGIQDGLYNIKDGEIFKYKAKGGTVRPYKLVPSVSAERVDRNILWTIAERFQDEETKAFAKDTSGLKEHATWNKAIRILEEYMEEGDNDND